MNSDSPLLVGILHFNSVYRFPQNLRGTPQYKWTPLNDPNGVPEFLVASSNKYLKNQYAIIQLKAKTDPRPTGILLQIIGEIGNTYAEIETRAHYRRIFFKRWKLPPTPLRLPPSTQHLDCQDLTVYSIDPEGCRDIDDAFSFESENRRLGIHIADVSYLLQAHGLLDMSAFQNRYSSIYFPNGQVNHMIPESLATDQASLLPNQTRYAWTLWINLQPDSNQVAAWRFQRTIIKSRRAFTYDEADLDPEIQSISKIVRELGTNMLQLKYGQWTTHEMIEVLMVIANHLVAKFIHERSPLGIYRTHSQPKEICTSTNPCDPALTKFLNILNSQAAEYTFDTGNYYHYGLQIDKYTHFTSPIRRFVDIYVHLLLGHVIDPEKNPLPSPQTTINIAEINDFHHRAKLFQRDLDKIKLISLVQTQKVHQGYIIECNDNDCDKYILDVYFPTHKILASFPLLHKNIISLFKIVNHSTHIEISYSHCTINIEKQSLMNFHLYPQPDALYLSQKIKFEIPALADFIRTGAATNIK